MVRLKLRRETNLTYKFQYTIMEMFEMYIFYLSIFRKKDKEM